VALPDLEEVYVLKLRIKYSKLGNLRFIGHLDVMRYFQKEIRRAGLDVSYSKGFSPHQIISFAAPLAMGITSDGEYFDGEFESVTHSADMIEALNSVSVEEIKVTKCVLLPDDAKNSMSVVAASDYIISSKSDGKSPVSDKELSDFFAQENIIVLKKTKKSEKEENIKPGILKLENRENGIYMLLCTGSEYNLKPELVMEAIYGFTGRDHNPFEYHIHRIETYMNDQSGRLIPLYEAGQEF
jgi:radical SAM-linked protein